MATTKNLQPDTKLGQDDFGFFGDHSHMIGLRSAGAREFVINLKVLRVVGGKILSALYTIRLREQ